MELVVIYTDQCNYKRLKCATEVILLKNKVNKINNRKSQARVVFVFICLL